jgi:hypothetical protein
VFQARLTVESDRSFVPRPNPRGRQDGDDPDDRIADLQYRDVMEFAVGHGTATNCAVVSGTCKRVETTWTPTAEVERVEPMPMKDVELGMEALARLDTGSHVREVVGIIVRQYRDWIGRQRNEAPREGAQGEVSDELLKRATLAAERIQGGLDVLDEPLSMEAFRLTNRAMAMAARQRRSQERGVAPATVDPPGRRPFQLAFVLMNLRSFSDQRATWHAKVVVIDDQVSLVTSANFTEWAHQRNVEAGVLIRNAEFARHLRQQFEGLVQSRAVLEVPGFRS